LFFEKKYQTRCEVWVQKLVTMMTKNNYQIERKDSIEKEANSLFLLLVLPRGFLLPFHYIFFLCHNFIEFGNPCHVSYVFSFYIYIMLNIIFYFLFQDLYFNIKLYFFNILVFKLKRWKRKLLEERKSH
jgi:hypothetical protein